MGANLQNCLETGSSGKLHFEDGWLIAGMASSEVPFFPPSVYTYLSSPELLLLFALF